MKIDDLTETSWIEPEVLAWRQRLTTTACQAFIDFSDLQWTDLWPLSQIVKLLYHRSVENKPAA
jgi:hypothetical protein